MEFARANSTSMLHLSKAPIDGAHVTDICYTRPKPAYGRQGLGWDRQARIQFRQVQFGMDTLWEYITNKGPQLTSFGAKTLRH